MGFEPTTHCLLARASHSWLAVGRADNVVHTSYYKWIDRGSLASPQCSTVRRILGWDATTQQESQLKCHTHTHTHTHTRTHARMRTHTHTHTHSILNIVHQYRGRVYPVYHELGFLGALCIALTWPGQLSCLGSSVVEHLPSKRCVTCSSPT